MKKLYTSFFLLAFLGISQLSFGQFYDGFAGTGNIGGNCTTVGATADCASNGWLTHSGTVGTIDIVSGSLSYTGLQASTGGKIHLTGTAALTRDVNAVATVTGNVAYYSALINVVDSTDLSITGYDYFLGLAASAGNASVTAFGGRLGIKAVNTNKANFRLGILNTSGGTTGTSFTDCGIDLNYGTTYLVVVKYDKSTVPTTASLWINPTTLGGADPAGSVTNNVGTSTFATFAAVFIRNGYSSTILGGTPNVDIDEIRVGSTFASVTPLSTGINEVSDISVMNVYPNPATNMVTIAAKEAISNVSIYDFQGRLVQQYDFNNSTEVKLNVSELSNGIYSIVANSVKGNSFSTKLVK
ncbi:MAG: T9SS type A sorting domain-containing protein [Bacteroidia bacterium]|nr:T9SS type A sorting domain-containing protein [Bacteroidia bacterium]